MNTFNELRAEIGPEKTLADLTAEDVDKITEHYRSGVEWNNYTALRYECVLKYEAALKEAGLDINELIGRAIY